MEDAIEKPTGTFKRVSHRQHLQLVSIQKTTLSIKDDTRYIRNRIDGIEKKNDDAYFALSSVAESLKHYKI